MMRGVSDATHIPVQNPKPDARVKKLQYWEHLVMVMTTEKSNKNIFLNTFMYEYNDEVHKLTNGNRSAFI